MKKKLIVIAGPTASGKTDTSIELAKRINGEIISADSMLVYKYMNIGTAKPTAEEIKKVKHYMIDEVYPDYEFSIATFKDMVNGYIEEVYKKDKIPILVGGTGFYINSIIYNTEFTKNDGDKEYRKYLEKLCEEKGKEYLHNMLKVVDVKSYEKIHMNNVKKVIRALEFYKETNTPISEHNENEKKKEKYYNTTMFIFNHDRDVLYERINMRVDNMIMNGLVEEVEGLIQKGYNKSLTSMQGIGYKEVINYLEGETTKEEAIECIKKNTRNFAKRQLTWFKHQSDGIWVNINDFEDRDSLINFMLENIED